MVDIYFWIDIWKRLAEKKSYYGKTILDRDIINILGRRREIDKEWLKELEKLGLRPKYVPGRLGSYIDFLTRVISPLNGILYQFEIMVFTGFIYEEAAQIYARLALKYLCPLAIARLIIELYPRLMVTSTQIRTSVEVPRHVRFPGAMALYKYAEAVAVLTWAIEEIGRREGLDPSELWYEGGLKEEFLELVEKKQILYAEEISSALEWYEKMFGGRPEI